MTYIEIYGRLGADPEVKASKNGREYVSLRIATNDYINGQIITTWCSVSWFGEHAMKMKEHMKKGSSVVVRGVPRFRIYDNKEGNKEVGIDIMADRVDFNTTSGSTQTNEATTIDVNAYKAKQIPPQPQDAPKPSADDDDLPF